MLAASPQHTPENSLEYLAAIRGWAALVVLLSHAVQIFGLPFWGLHSWPHRISSTASEYAVVVFFLLSGFLIAHSMEQNRARNGRAKLVEFLVARFARIYPPLVFALLVSAAIFGLFVWFSLPGVSDPFSRVGDLYSARDLITLTRSEFFTALVLKHGMLSINGPLWSLYIEVKLYVLFACAYCLFRGSSKPIPMMVSVALFAVVASSGVRHNPEFLYYGVVWLLGCFSYYLWRAKRLQLSGKESWFCLFAMLTFIGFGAVSSHLQSGKWSTWVDAAKWIELLVSAFLAYLMFRKSTNIPAGQAIAPWSYSLYVVHFPVLLLFQALLIQFNVQSPYLSAIVAILGCLVAAVVAIVGGIIEKQKDAVQIALLSARRKIMQNLSMAFARNE